MTGRGLPLASAAADGRALACSPPPSLGRCWPNAAWCCPANRCTGWWPGPRNGCRCARWPRSATSSGARPSIWWSRSRSPVGRGGRRVLGPARRRTLRGRRSGRGSFPPHQRTMTAGGSRLCGRCGRVRPISQRRPRADRTSARAATGAVRGLRGLRSGRPCSGVAAGRPVCARCAPRRAQRVRALRADAAGGRALAGRPGLRLLLHRGVASPWHLRLLRRPSPAGGPDRSARRDVRAMLRSGGASHMCTGCGDGRAILSGDSSRHVLPRVSLSTRGSAGRPSTPSATMLSSISEVPPSMELPFARRWR